MAGYVILGTLAAFGALCVLWACFGWLLPGGRGGAMVCVGIPDEGLIARYQWLRGLGLIACPLLVVTEEGEAILPDGVEICSPEELLLRLEWERKKVDGTGNGDSPGYD